MTEPNISLLRVLRGETVEPSPIWIMRQAGRYLPEYRATRAEAGSFLDLCFSPELATEVTLQPIRRFGFDAAILFSDILVIPWALGQKVDFVEGVGPVLEPITTGAELAALDPSRLVERLSPVLEAVSRIRAALPAETGLIGFAGAPWTLATYMIGGRGSPDQAKAKLAALNDPTFFDALMALLSACCEQFLAAQIEAGVDVVKLFDSWAGSVPPTLRERAVLAPTERVVSGLRSAHPDTPIIAFPRGFGFDLPHFAERVKPDGLALDQSAPAGVHDALRPHVSALQGNMDPIYMRAELDVLRRELDHQRSMFQGAPHILNLGHGVTPETNIANVAELVRYWRDGA